LTRLKLAMLCITITAPASIIISQATSNRSAQSAKTTSPPLLIFYVPSYGKRSAAMVIAVHCKVFVYGDRSGAMVIAARKTLVHSDGSRAMVIAIMPKVSVHLDITPKIPRGIALRNYSGALWTIRPNAVPSFTIVGTRNPGATLRVAPAYDAVRVTGDTVHTHPVRTTASIDTRDSGCPFDWLSP
jgi:hypothetical protein